jgi:hypothetical protein
MARKTRKGKTRKGDLFRSAMNSLKMTGKFLKNKTGNAFKFTKNKTGNEKI